LGVEQIDSTVETLTVRGIERSITLADGSVLIAKDIVLANGSFAQALVDQVPEIRTATPRLLWGAGSAVDMAFPSWITRGGGGLDRNILDMNAVIRTTDRGGACGIHVIPYGNGEYYVGASSGVWFEPEYKARLHAVEVLLRSVCEEINYAFFYAGIELRGPGFRPTTVDTFPLLGQSHVSGIWFANGTKRDGFTCSPYIANELAAAILGRRPSRLPQRFTPSRKIISYKNRQQALGDAIVANVGGEFQHGLRLPPYALDAYYTQKRVQYEAIYDKRGFAEFGIHPEVLHIYDNDGYFAAVDIPRELA
jgi:glycine oxidase